MEAENRKVEEHTTSRIGSRHGKDEWELETPEKDCPGQSWMDSADEYLAIQWSYSGVHSNNEKNIEDHVYYEANGEYFTVIKIPSTVVKSGTLIEYSPLTFCDGIDYVENIPGNMMHYKNTSINIMSDVVCQDIQNAKCPIIGCNVKSHSNNNNNNNNNNKRSLFCFVCLNHTEPSAMNSNKPINKGIKVSNNESTYSTEVITEQTINNPLLPKTFSLISYEQQLLQSGRNVDVDLVMRRFTISLLLPFLLIATVLCIAFPLFLYRRQSRYVLRLMPVVNTCRSDLPSLENCVLKAWSNFLGLASCKINTKCSKVEVPLDQSNDEENANNDNESSIFHIH
ncbi:unnamed protein product [Schistosoma margrebowiei]|uniref:Uncharacterized protein n=1 Tax=Schistosoma margrebowiei TaxID=48269 RepID=A0A183LMX3_9TREM|nr:unnamed protein product [Schistosoma margrebowiei]